MATVLISRVHAKTQSEQGSKSSQKLNHLVGWVNAQTSSGAATTIFIEGCLQTLDTALLQEACFLLFGLGWVFLNSFFKIHSKFVRQKCGDPGPLQQLPIYRKQYWTNRNDFNACQWLSRSRRHSEVPKNQ